MADRYLNGKIYTIRSYLTDDIYIGSTCLPLHKRLYAHRDGYNRYIKNGKYVSSYDILNFADHYIELLEAFPCNSKAELLKKEGEYIRSMTCVNRCIAGRSQKEYYTDNKDEILEHCRKYRATNNKRIVEEKREYYKTNKEIVLLKIREHYKEHKDAILERNKLYRETEKGREKCKEYALKTKDKKLARSKEKITCECGCIIARGNASDHRKTAKHLKLMAALLPIESPEEENPSL